jgi:hypothetical protein
VRGARAGNAEGLAGEATTDKIDSSKPTQSACIKRADVIEAGDIGPVLAENGLAELVTFAEGDCSHSSSLESEAKSANAGEQIQHSEFRHVACSRMLSAMTRTKHCGKCGTRFEPANAWQKFCSFKCQQNALSGEAHGANSSIRVARTGVGLPERTRFLGSAS